MPSGKLAELRIASSQFLSFTASHSSVTMRPGRIGLSSQPLRAFSAWRARMALWRSCATFLRCSTLARAPASFSSRCADDRVELLHAEQRIAVDLHVDQRRRPAQIRPRARRHVVERHVDDLAAGAQAAGADVLLAARCSCRAGSRDRGSRSPSRRRLPSRSRGRRLQFCGCAVGKAMMPLSSR